jgi:hypothetical protein
LDRFVLKAARDGLFVAGLFRVCKFAGWVSEELGAGDLKGVDEQVLRIGRASAERCGSAQK